MNIVGLSIARPVGVTVGVALLVMFGLLGLREIPIQLTPTVDRPIVTVSTQWPGRSPEEIVDEITKEQEERLKNVANLKDMTSLSREGGVDITLEFFLGTDIARALAEVDDALRQVPSYPDEVDQPTRKAADGASENAIAWIIVDLDPATAERHPEFDITTLYDALDKEVKPALERIDGVAEVNIFGGREREVRVMIDQSALAQRGLNQLDVLRALRQENNNASAGTIAEGKRNYRVRLVGRFTTPEQVLQTVVAFRGDRPVYVKDVAKVEIDHTKRQGFVRSFGSPSIAINVIRQSNANVVDVMEQLRAELEIIRTQVLPNLGGDSVLPSGERVPVGPDLQLRQVYDETTYIDSAIDLVRTNLWIGGMIAAVVLLVFLRSFVSTGIIAIAIPVSVIGTFLVMLGLGRTLNVVSLAGLAFAVGMVVDNAIVVLENIYRRLQQGDTPMVAAYKGGREVWGAILASTLTTVAVFVPVLTVSEEAGQLFRDIAIAIVAAVCLSLLVSITVIPAACSRWLRPHTKDRHPLVRAWHAGFGLAPLFGKLVDGFVWVLRWCVTGWRGLAVRPAVIVVLTSLSVIGAGWLMPPLDYLPAGNRNLVFGGLLTPPGLSVEQYEDIAQTIERQVLPYARVDTSDPAAVASLPPIRRGFPGASDGPPPFDPVPVDNFFIGAFGGSMFAGGTSEYETVVIPVGQLLTNAMASVPDAYGGARQSSIFGRGVGGGNSIDLEIRGPSLDKVKAAAGFMFGIGMQNPEIGPTRMRANPGNFNLEQPEWRLALTNRGRELGLTNTDAATVARSLFDGAFVGDFLLNGEAVDLVLLPEGGRLAYKEQLASIPIYTPVAGVVPLDTVFDVLPGLAPQEIQRIEELPAVTLQITPMDGEPIAAAQERIRRTLIEPAQRAGLIDRTMRVGLEGTAAKLDEVQAVLLGTPREGSVGGGLTPTGRVVLIVLGGAALIGAVWTGVLAAVRRARGGFYGVMGVLLAGAAIAGLALLMVEHPQLAFARFVWALAVTYLLMCALFESFVYPFVIMFTVPLAIVGGFAGLAVVHEVSVQDPTLAPQNLDVLTMLGFIILVGVVVNNAILIVHQALNFMRGVGDAEDDRVEPLSPIEAALESTRSRVRPIFMSVLTSVGGMAPLVLFPGAGSEMYRGLGSVVVGGLLCSTVFTLVLVPMLLTLVFDMSSAFRRVYRRRDLQESVAAGARAPAALPA